METTGQTATRLPTRYCTKCRFISEDLELFVKDSGSRYGRRNLCKECANKNNREKESGKYKHKYQLSKRYNCTPEEYEDRMNTSDKCQVCATTEELCYDHDHTTGEFRGVLCRKCNIAIGQLGDTLSSLHKAYMYLVQHYTLKD